MASWTPYTVKYNPLAAGSIDGTDTEPHDRAVVRAMNANYTPSDINSKADHTLLWVDCLTISGKINYVKSFPRFGRLESVRIVRDIVTGQSKGYGFIEFRHKNDANEAWRETQQLEIEGYSLIVDREAGHTLKGWVPRRLGGGWGGRKEAGQLRFGCVERPWRRPIVLPQQSLGPAEGGPRFSDSDKRRERVGPLDDRGSRQQPGDTSRHGHRKDRYYEKERYSDKGKERYSDKGKEKYSDKDKERYSDKQDRKDHRHSRHEGKSFRYSRQDERETDYGEREGKDRDYCRHEEKGRDYGEREGREKDYGEREGREIDYGEREGRERDYGEREGRVRDYGERYGKERDYGERERRQRDYGEREGRERDYGEREGKERDYGEQEGRDRDHSKHDEKDYYSGRRDRKDRDSSRQKEKDYYSDK